MSTRKVTTGVRTDATAQEHARGLAWRSMTVRALADLGVTVVVGIAVIFLLAFRTPPTPAVRIDPAVVKSLNNKIRAVQNAGPEGQRILRVNETELNSLLAARIAASRAAALRQKTTATTKDGQAEVQDVKMTLSGDRVHVYIALGMRGQTMLVGIEGTLHTKNGYIDFDPISGNLGSIPLPRSGMEAVVRAIEESPQQHQALRLSPNLADLRVENGELVVTYK